MTYITFAGPISLTIIDYFHRVGKGNNLWLKMGTIRLRTNWYAHGDPPVGVKLADDADEIDLDLTLEKYSLTKDFLSTPLRTDPGFGKLLAQVGAASITPMSRVAPSLTF